MKIKPSKNAFAGMEVLSREKLKSITGGTEQNGGTTGEGIPNTWACDCGPGTSMAVYAESVVDVIPTYLSYVGDKCTWDIRCVPW